MATSPFSKEVFVCEKCGSCCRMVDELAPFLDRGDGICKHFDTDNNVCPIYDARPLICRGDGVFDLLHSHIMSKETHVELQNRMCKIMRNA